MQVQSGKPEEMLALFVFKCRAGIAFFRLHDLAKSLTIGAISLNRL